MKSFLKRLLTVFITSSPCFVWANTIIIPMDAEQQVQHLKAYGVAYHVLASGVEVDWLLNYDGGSFAFSYISEFEKLCKLKGIQYKVISDAQYAKVLTDISDADFNGDIIRLEKPPKIAVYTPKNKLPWDDAVTMALTFAEIPYDKVYDDELLADKLMDYDWLHLHHEDFTGQFGKFWGSYRNASWYIDDVAAQSAMAKKHGFQKVSQLKLAVSKKIRDFVMGGGYLFAMCTATDTYDIALAAEGTDICEEPFDGDPTTPNPQQYLDYTKSFAFKNYQLFTSPAMYEFSDIDNGPYTNRTIAMQSDYFNLFTFSAKFDPVPAMLTQNHTTTVKGFMGQTTAFRKETLKSNVIILGDNKSLNEARYIHGNYGKGTFTFYGGHDPEDYQHMVGDPPTDLELHPTSPGYRLILNNVLFPAAKKKPQKT